MPSVSPQCQSGASNVDGISTSCSARPTDSVAAITITNVVICEGTFKVAIEGFRLGFSVPIHLNMSARTAKDPEPAQVDGVLECRIAVAETIASQMNAAGLRRKNNYMVRGRICIISSATLSCSATMMLCEACLMRFSRLA